MGNQGRNQSRPSGAVHGILIVDKPGQMTSHDVVAKARRAFGTRRVGHAGTLDPMATGVLVLLLGEATKLSSVLTTDRKTYEARIQFGSSTDTLDADGKMQRRAQLSPGWLDRALLDGALEAERKRRLQIPPQVSAIKVEGKRSYARSRAGEEVDLAPRDVSVHQLEVLRCGEDFVDISLCVSKGYYVRSLARDVGTALEVPSHLSRLRRTHSGPFSLEEACPLPLTGDESLLTIGKAARRSLPVLQVTPEGRVRLTQGKPLRPDDVLDTPPNDRPVLLAAYFGEALIALVEPSDHSEFRVKRGINDPSADTSTLPPTEFPG